MAAPWLGSSKTTKNTTCFSMEAPSCIANAEESCVLAQAQVYIYVNFLPERSGFVEHVVITYNSQNFKFSFCLLASGGGSST
jgi:hypothetical protein